MGEKTPSWIFRTLQILIPLAGVAVGITGVLLTVASRKKEITCTLVNSTRLVSEDLGGIHPDMHVEFHGQSIFSLTKMTFNLRNTGAAAVMEKDVVEPLRLAFPQTTKLMSASVERTFPSDLSFLARAAPQSESVELDFPLLNRGDEALFSVYVFNSEAQRPNFEGRIVDVPQLVYLEANISAPRQGTWPFQSHATRSVVRWVLVSIYLALALLFLGIWVSGVASYVKYQPWKHKWKHLYDAVVAEREKSKKPEVTSAIAETVGPEMEHLISQSEALQAAALRGHVLLYDEGLKEELSKRGIPRHPNPMVESLSGLAALAAVTLTTAFVVYRGLAS